MNAIEVKDVSVYYGNLCAIRDVNLNVKEKEFLGIIGPNGAGKSTLLKVILGLIKPVSGEVRIFGKDLKETNKILGYIPQTSGFDRNFPINVLDVVLMGRLKNRLSLFHRYAKEDMEIVTDLLDKLGLSDVRDRQIGQLSGGQLQRVLIARALAIEPKIILLDEPTASIDANSRSQIYSLLKELNEEMTIVVVTHDLAAVSAYFDSIACLNKELHYHGDKELDEETVEKIYGCPVELIAHGVPHRVFKVHEEGYDD
ncbi:MAG: zinc transport system ATP-binding protein [Halanaerobiales bacterium]|nr:zinc transport system ATP-binding protein [Halanaerobiales bacterium]